MSLGTFWIDEAPAPIKRITLEGGEVAFYADITGITINRGTLLIRITDPEGSVVCIGRTVFPEQTQGEAAELRQTIRMRGSRPGEPWVEPLVEEDQA